MYGEMYALSYTKKPSLMLASLSICLLDCLKVQADAFIKTM